MKKKLISMLLATTLLVGSITGCGNKDVSESTSGKTEDTKEASPQEVSSEAEEVSEEAEPEIENFNAEGYPIVNEPITLKVLIAFDDSVVVTDLSKYEQFQKMEEVTGIHLEFEVVKAADWSTRSNLIFTTGEYPDIIFANVVGGLNSEEYGVVQQILSPLDDLMQYLPNYTDRIIESGVDPVGQFVASDGQTYALGCWNPQGFSNDIANQVYINQEWLDALGLQMPTNIEELTEVLRAFRDNDPNGNGEKDEIPVLGSVNVSMGDYLTMFGLVRDGWWGLYITDDKKVTNIKTTEEYRDMLEWLHLCYEEDLLDPEFFSMDDATYKAKVNEGAGGLMTGYRLNNGGWDNAIDIYSFMLNEEAKYPFSLPAARPAVYITETNEHKEASMRMLNYMLEYDVLRDFYHGPRDSELQGWRINADGLTEVYSNADAVSEKFQLSSSGFFFYTGQWYSDNYVLQPKVVEKIGYENQIKEAGNYMKYTPAYLGRVETTQEQNEKLNLINTDMDTAENEFMIKFIKEGVTDASWEEYVSIIEDMDLAYKLQVYQEGIDALGL